MPKLEKSILLERYEIIEPLGRGGMADVYKALDHHRKYPVAIKLLRDDLAQDPDLRHRFKDEATVLAKLTHNNIVRFYSYEESEEVAFLVMDYVEGITLRRRITNACGPLLLSDVVKVLEQVCRGLAYAHEEGFIHRDIKPANIMLKADGNIVICDFGIAKVIEEAVTESTMSLGAPAYMSPEQVLGKPLDQRTDLYSLGLVTYEMLTGRRPFQLDGTSTVGSAQERIRHQQLHQLPTPPHQLNPDIPIEIEQAVMRALAKNPEDRPATAMDLWGEFKAGLLGAELRGSVAVQPNRISSGGVAVASPSVEQAAIPSPRLNASDAEIRIPGAAHSRKDVAISALDTTRVVGTRTLKALGVFVFRLIVRLVEELLIIGAVFLVLAALLSIVLSFALARFAETGLRNARWQFELLSPTTPYEISRSDFARYTAPYIEQATLSTIKDVRIAFTAPNRVFVWAAVFGNLVVIDGTVLAKDGAPRLSVEHFNNMPLPVIDGIISDGINQGLKESWANAPVRVEGFEVSGDTLRIETANK